MGDDERASDNSDLPLDDGVYIADEDDTFEKMKRGLKKFGKDLKKGAEDIADSSKKLATKSKEKMDAALEERRQKKAMKDPLTFPWSSLTVPDLKERLRDLGLAVSGKKDDLIERILEHYRTEIPTDEDGTPQLIEELEPIEETPPAPDLDELVKNDEVEEVVEEIISEPTPVVEEVAAETPVYQFEESEQMYVYDPPTNMKKQKKKARKVSNNVNIIYGLLMLVLTVTILNNGFDMGLNLGMIYDFIGECFVGSYGGMSASQTTALAGMLSLILFMASLMYISGRQYAAAYLAKISIIVSISIRLFATFDEGVSDTMDILGNLVFDLIFLIPFSFSIWIPAMLKTSLPEEYFLDSDTFTSPLEPISDVFSEESFTVNGLSGAVVGDAMSEFQVTKPKRPSRRGRVVFFYEGFFLILATVLWPALIYSLVALASLDFRNSQGLPADFDSNSITGQAILALLFILASICTYAVYRYDREAREGPIYAKSKAAYHEQMDQYLGLKNAYYELQAKKLQVQADMLSGQNES